MTEQGDFLSRLKTAHALFVRVGHEIHRPTRFPYSRRNPVFRGRIIYLIEGQETPRSAACEVRLVSAGLDWAPLFEWPAGLGPARDKRIECFVVC